MTTNSKNKIPTKRFHAWIGLSGVDDDENPRAQLWMKRFEIPLLIVAIWIVVSWYWESKTHMTDQTTLLNWVIWLFFLLETTTLTYLVKDKANYLKNNWLNVFIIVSGIPVLFIGGPYVMALRSLRLMIFFSLVLQLSTTIRDILARNHMGATLLVSSIFIVIAGYLIAGIDPAITSPANGIWWAWVTASTVGYGDIVPTSPEGRILGGILILMGIGLFSLITANFSVYFMTQSQNQNKTKELEIIKEKLQHIENLLEEKNKKDDLKE